MIHVVRELEGDANRFFEAFCDAESIPNWVHAVVQAKVVSRYPDGRAAKVDFVSEDDEGATLAYSLIYSYELETLRVSWRTEGSMTEGVRGFASFATSSPGRFKITYFIHFGQRATGEQDEEVARANAVIDALVAHVAGSPAS